MNVVTNGQRLTITAATLVFVVGCRPQRPWQDAMTNWEALGQDADAHQVEVYEATVRKAARPGHAPLLDRLLAIVKASSHSAESRAKALSLVCELADRRSADRIVAYLQEQLPGLTQTVTPGVNSLSDAAPLYRVFMRGGGHHLIDVLEDHRPLLRLATDYYLIGSHGGKTRKGCARLIAECHVPDTERQAAILRIISRWPSIVAAEPLIDAIRPETILALRRLVRAGDTSTTFNYAAADALAELGDTGIVADLEARLPAFRAEGRNYDKYLERYLWRIEVQQSPERLLDQIAGGESLGDADQRRWAVRKASKMGLPADRIRKAILAHASQDLSPHERAHLPRIKREAIALGILGDGDLPDVPLPPSR